jgi:DNA-binding beta-propeller fold protein YncE
MLKQLQCPSCNAPLTYDGAAPTIQCPYCDSTVVVPEAWRTAARTTPPAAAPAATPTAPQPRSAPRARRAQSPPPVHDPDFTLQRTASGRGGCLAIFLVLALVIGGAGAAMYAFQPAIVTTQVADVVNVVTQQLSMTEFSSSVQSLNVALADDHAQFLGRFGSEGIGPGRFEDARAIAVDNAGRLYVGEYGSGRIQVFDTEGVFQTQWRLGDNDFYVDQFAANRSGALYIPYKTALGLYEGVTGVQLGALPPADSERSGWYQDSVVVGADGAVYGVWDDDIVRFDRSGALTLRIADAIVAAVGGVETTTKLAVDGLGNIYALGVAQDVVVKYDANGAFVDRIAVANRGADDEPAKLRAAMALAVDSRGQLYVADIFGIKVYDGDGQYVGVIDTPGVAFGLAIDDNDILYVAARTEVLRYQLQ